MSDHFNIRFYLLRSSETIGSCSDDYFHVPLRNFQWKGASLLQNALWLYNLMNSFSTVCCCCCGERVVLNSWPWTHEVKALFLCCLPFPSPTLSRASDKQIAKSIKVAMPSSFSSPLSLLTYRATLGCFQEINCSSLGPQDFLDDVHTDVGTKSRKSHCNSSVERNWGPMCYVDSGHWGFKDYWQKTQQFSTAREFITSYRKIEALKFKLKIPFELLLGAS